MFKDRGIIPKCFNGLDNGPIHLYVIKRSLIKGIVLIITKCS